MADVIQLDIVTPERRVISEPVQEVTIPGETGYLGILPGHAPLLTALGVGEISYRGAAGLKRLAVAWGFAEVLGGKVTILAETAERPEEIDVSRAHAAKERAEKRLKAPPTDLDYARAEEALKRAQTRLDVAQGK